MTLFSLLATGLSLLALLWVLWPLLRQSTPLPPLPQLSLVAGTLVVLPLLVYALLGSPQAISRHDAQVGSDDMAQLVSGLQQRLDQRPDDADGWLLLARSRVVSEDWAGARDAYAQRLRLKADDHDARLQMAEVIARLQQGRLTGEARTHIEQVLASEADHPLALWLAGLAAQQAGEVALARRHWQQLLSQLPPDSPDTQRIRRLLEQLQTSAP